MNNSQQAMSAMSRQRHNPKVRFGTLRNVIALMLREMSSSYGRTPGGYIWSVVEPMAAIIFLSLGFSLLLRAPSLGTSFFLFYATGYLPLAMYIALSNAAARSIQFSRPLLRFPAVSWIDAVIARVVLNTLTNVTISVLLFIIILSFVENRAILNLAPIVEAFALCVLLGSSVGVLNCCLFGLFPVWEVIWGVLTRPLFLASGVIFIYEDLPRFAQDLLWYNPLMHITGLMRTGFYPTYSAAYMNLTYVVMSSMTVLSLGLLLTRRYNRDILNK